MRTKILIEGWRKEYYQVRPQSALGYRPPAPEAIISMGLTLEVGQSLGEGQDAIKKLREESTKD